MTLTQKRLVAMAIFWGGLAVLIGFEAIADTWLEVHWGKEATISRAMRDSPPIVIWAFGFISGGVLWGLAAHFFWNQPYRGTPDPDRDGGEEVGR